MKQFEVYRNIRKKALIYGLPVTLFALMMLGVLASLLAIIFSFSLLTITVAVSLNLVVYVFFIRLAANPQLLHLRKVFPTLISNKKSTGLHYEN